MGLLLRSGTLGCSSGCARRCTSCTLDREDLVVGEETMDCWYLCLRNDYRVSHLLDDRLANQSKQDARGRGHQEAVDWEWSAPSGGVVGVFLPCPDVMPAVR